MKDPLTRVELITRFTIKPTDNEKGQQFVRIGIVERGSEFDAPFTLILRPSVTGFLMVTPSYSNKPNTSMDGDPDMRLKPDGKSEYEARIIRRDGQVEVFLNGRRLAYLPVDDKIEKTDMVLWVTGMTMEIKQLQFSRIEERK